MPQISTQSHKPNSIREDIVWLECTRQTFQQLAQRPDLAVLEGIIAEGQSRLAKVSPDDPLLAGYLHLAIAEAQLNLGLELDDPEARLTKLTEGKETCEQTAQELQSAHCGVACTLLPRVITLLAALFKAAPEIRETGLTDNLQRIAAQLDDALLMQVYLRENALEKLQTARILLASMEAIDSNDRKKLLIKIAIQILEAGDIYLETGDLEMVTQVHADLAAIEASLNDPALPVPDLAVFKKPIDELALLPEIDFVDNKQTETQPDIYRQSVTSYPPQSTLSPSRKRPSPLRWVISIVGLATSCLTLLCSGASLYTGLASRVPFLSGKDTSISLTQTAFSIQMTTIAPRSAPTAGGQLMNPLSPLPIPSPSGEQFEPTQSNLSSAMDGIIFFDFSSPQGWPTGIRETTTFGVENGKYVTSVNAERGWSDVILIPVDFLPRSIKFDFLIPAEYADSNGGFDLLCYYQIGSYHYFSFTPGHNQMFIGNRVEGNFVGGDTYSLTSFQPAGNNNQIEITCDEYSMAVTINGQGEYGTFHQQQVQLGTMAFFAGGSDLGSAGFKLLLDNIYVYKTLP